MPVVALRAGRGAGGASGAPELFYVCASLLMRPWRALSCHPYASALSLLLPSGDGLQ